MAAADRYPTSYESWPDRFPQPPLPLRKPETGIALHDLSEDKRRKIWEWIKRNDPALLAQLRSPGFQAWRDGFNATIVLERDYIERALRAEAA